MKFKIATLCLLFSVIYLSSCEDIIDVDLNSVDPELVIEGVIRMGENPEVLITKTKDFGDNNDYPPITDAQVVITDDAGNSETLQTNEAGKYIATTLEGTERRTYSLSVTYGDKQYTASTRMPPRVELDSLTMFKFPMVDFYDPMVHFVDPVGEENQYYRFVMAINGEWPKLRMRLMSTEFVDGSIIRQPIFVRFDDDRDDGPIQSGDVITVEMRCLDKGTYTFFETMDNGDFALANPTSNITGGALGYFGAYSYTRKEIEMNY